MDILRSHASQTDFDYNQLLNLASGTRVDHLTNGGEGTITIYDKSKVSIGVIDNDGVINLAWLLMI